MDGSKKEGRPKVGRDKIGGRVRMKVGTKGGMVARRRVGMFAGWWRR